MSIARARGWMPRAGVVLVSCAVLLLIQFWGTAVVLAHPGVPMMTAAEVELDTTELLPATVAAPAPMPTASREPTRATPSAWICVTLLAISGIRAARGWGGRRSLALAVAVVLGVFVVEGAVHSVHHLKDPRQAERCPVYSASQHVTVLSAGSPVPDLVPPALTERCPTVPGIPLAAQTLPVNRSRAPPSQSA